MKIKKSFGQKLNFGFGRALIVSIFMYLCNWIIPFLDLCFSWKCLTGQTNALMVIIIVAKVPFSETLNKKIKNE